MDPNRTIDESQAQTTAAAVDSLTVRPEKETNGPSLRPNEVGDDPARNLTGKFIDHYRSRAADDKF